MVPLTGLRVHCWYWPVSRRRVTARVLLRAWVVIPGFCKRTWCWRLSILNRFLLFLFVCFELFCFLCLSCFRGPGSHHHCGVRRSLFLWLCLSLWGLGCVSLPMSLRHCFLVTTRCWWLLGCWGKCRTGLALGYLCGGELFAFVNGLIFSLAISPFWI